MAMFEGRLSDYIDWERVHVARQIDLTYKVTVPGTYWRPSVSSGWALFSRELDGVVREVVGAEGLERVTFNYAEVSTSGTTLGVIEYGEFTMIGSLEWLRRLQEQISAFTDAIDLLADDSGARSVAIDDQDRKLGAELVKAFDDHAKAKRP